MGVRSIGTVAVAVLTLCAFAVNGYEIVYPFKADGNGNKREFSTNIDGKHQDEVVFVLKRDTEDMVLELKRNVGFHAKKILVRTFNDEGKAKTELHAPKSCYYSGKIADKDDSYVALDTCDGLRGSIEDGAKRYNLEPIESKKDDGAHKLYEVENDDEDLLKKTLGVNPLPKDYIEVPTSEEDVLAPETTSDDEGDETPHHSLVPDVDPVYAKYPITHKTRFCEMYMVVDHEIYVKYNKNKTLVLSKVLNVIHAVDRSYAAVNVRIVLVALDIWTDANKIPYNTSGGVQLSLFNKYRINNMIGVIRHDIAHFMSIKSWSGGVIGMAYVGGLCSNGAGTAINLWSFKSITGSNIVVAHELGHNFGFPHDTKECNCLTTRGCFMGGPKSRRPGFSDCNMKVLSNPNRSFQCLNNYPRGSLDNVCGNGIVEGSEECDCGTPELCKKQDRCCEPHHCKLKRSAQCSDFNTPDCCKDCLFKKQGTLCREAQNNCDLPEYCAGNSGTCPADVYMRDGTTCSSKISIIPANLDRQEKLLTFNPPIKARYFRFNPVYWPSTKACMRMEILTCSPNEAVVNVPQPISTRNLRYTKSLCLVPFSENCADSKANDSALIFKRTTYGDCNKPNYRFVLESDGTLRHKCSGKIVCPDSRNYLSLKTHCDDGKFERLSNFGLRHIKSGGCVEAAYGSPRTNRKVMLRWTKDCDGPDDKTKLHFLKTDCLLPIGMENRKLPDSAFSASKSDGYYPPKEARLNSGKSWCAPAVAGKEEYLQVDLRLMKTVRHMRIEGTYWNWVSGFKLYFSDDGENWKGYSSNDDLDKDSSSYCYSGSCPRTLNAQCKDLWDAGANSADNSCWNKLNSEANGFGTCDPASNQTCAQKDIFCGQLQCTSSMVEPQHVKYGSVYKSIMLNGAKCSAASITIQGSSNDQVGNGMGMVEFGTKCGDKKMCSGYSCKSFSELDIEQCPTVNGIECAGQGTCDNEGKCHCSGGHDPMTNCATALIAVDGSWGQWTDWSKCTAACNGGMKQRSRFCDAPFPAHGGSDCVGAAKEEEQCNTDACPNAKSCKLLMKKLRDSGKPMVDGVYDITMPDGTIMKMYCDMTRDGGGWTLVVTGHTNTWNTSDMVREWNKDKPTLWNDYSILKYVDQIKDNYNIYDDHFEYRLDAHSRGRWGGIWSAPISYNFDTYTSAQTDVKLTKKFDEWTPGDDGIANRMPHIIQNWLTTQTRTNKWGSITGNNKAYHPALWIKGDLKESKPEYIWYWLREGNFRRPFSCTELRLRALARGQKPKSGQYEIQTSDGTVLTTICDMNRFGGGWTLVLNKVSNSGWTKETTLLRNIDEASKSIDYSIISYAKGIARLKEKEESNFQYMLEADGNKRWGGVFRAKIEDAMPTSNANTKEPKLLKKFDNWDETKSNLAKRVPYLLDNPTSYLTTENTASNGEDGVIVSSTQSIYIKDSKEKPSFIRMWVREDASKKSCNQIKLNGERRGIVYKNGFYTGKKWGAYMQTFYCDMSSDPGAWTLLVTSAHGNWTKEQVLSRNENLPSTSNDYSILRIADSIKDLSNNATFKYKLDANKMNRWGGIWEAPIEYTFLFESNKQERVKLLKQFDKWDYNVWSKSICNRMPWLGDSKGILTTSSSSLNAWWGTIISDNLEYNPAPWLNPGMKEPGLIWYWINEDDCSSDRKPVDGKFTEWSEWTPCSVYCGQGESTRFRQCVKPRCGGAPCDTNVLTKETKQCTGECRSTLIRSYDSQYCLLPARGGCDVSDETLLVWRSGSDYCDLPEAEYIVDLDHGIIIHKCSGKPVCPKGGSTSYNVKTVISSKCPSMKLTKRFTRTMFGTLHFGDKCLQTINGNPRSNYHLILWPDCSQEKYKMLFNKLETGPVHAKMWKNVVNTKGTIDDLLNDVRFPNNPTSTGVLDNFDSPSSIGNNYGILLWTYFKAPETGMYTFHSACDDTCQIFLSTNDQEADKQKIVDQKGWSRQYQFDKRSDQTSKKISLMKGNLYYLEGILYESGGGDHLSVAVDLPSGLRLTPITNFYLRGKI